MRSSKSRSRSKSNRNNNRSVGNIVNRVFDSSGPEGKVRGTPQQIIDKYNQLARDAQLANDRVATENFQQHAEHYLRMLSQAQKEQDARREQQEQQNRERQAERDRERAARQEREAATPPSAAGTGDQPDLLDAPVATPTSAVPLRTTHSAPSHAVLSFVQQRTDVTHRAAVSARENPVPWESQRFEGSGPRGEESPRAT